MSKIAEANIFVTGDNLWRQFEQWPPAGVDKQVLYLQEDGKMEQSRPETAVSFNEYISDPAKPVPYTEDVHFKRTREYMTDDQCFAERRPDVLSFKTAILSEDITVTGVVTADLFTSISSTDADFVGKLIDLFPDSLSYNNVKATIRIYHDKMISGNILLPVLKKQILSLRITLEEKTLIPDYQS